VLDGVLGLGNLILDSQETNNRQKMKKKKNLVILLLNLLAKDFILSIFNYSFYIFNVWLFCHSSICFLKHNDIQYPFKLMLKLFYLFISLQLLRIIISCYNLCFFHHLLLPVTSLTSPRVFIFTILRPWTMSYSQYFFL